MKQEMMSYSCSIPRFQVKQQKTKKDKNEQGRRITSEHEPQKRFAHALDGLDFGVKSKLTAVHFAIKELPEE